MQTLIDLLYLAGGLVALYFGAEVLIKGSVNLALRLGLSPLLVGLTVVAFGTSAPELVVCLNAVLQDKPDLAVGNVVGSNICNIGLILGVGALVRPMIIKVQVIKQDAPLLLLFTGIFIAMMSDRVLARWEGAVLVGLLFAYLAGRFLQARKEEDPDVLVEFEDAVGGGQAGGDGDTKPAMTVWRSVLMVVVGMVLLVKGADFLIIGGVNLARQFGVSEAVIGLSLVAVGTSLPELATSIVGALRRQGDIVTGNAIGSCIFNLLCVMGTTALVRPIAPEGVRWLDFGVMAGFSVLILPMFMSQKRLARWEGVFLLVLYAGYCLTLLR